MGRFTNPVLIAAGTALIVVGIAAQTGTVDLGGRNGAQGAKVVASPGTSPSAHASPTPPPSPTSAAPVAAQSGGGQEDGGDGGD